MRRALQAISDRLSRLEVQVAVLNREMAQNASSQASRPFAAQARPTGYRLNISSPVIDPEKAEALMAHHRQIWAKARKVSQY